jgi:PST family polysaccharide transporter
MIAGLMALAPHVIVLAYSTAFLPAATLLQWMLIGDLFKFASYTMAFAILARGLSVGYLITEAVAGIAYLVSAYFGMRLFGLIGLGVAWIVTYVIYLLVVWLVARRRLGVKISLGNALLLIAGVVLVCAAKLMAAQDAPTLRLYGPLLLTLIAAGGAFFIVRRDSGSRRPIE